MTPSAATVDVVIVAHNAGDLLAEAVASAAAQAGVESVWVVDAASADGSVVAAARRRPGFHTISASNEGFAAGNNRGIAATGAPFVLLLNPDALLLLGALDALVAAAQAQPRAAIVGALVLDLDGGVQAGSFGRFPTLASVVAERLRGAVSRARDGRRRSPRRPATLTSVDWVTGAAMLVRRDAIADAGPMDEGFFLYYEDVEWCHRMRTHGWDVLVEPAAQVAHHRGAAAASSSVVQDAYRASFYRYCDLRGLWGLKALSRALLPLRRLAGGRA
jgi:N-acetylglucosaminyl-diphospho-decaprenol L-rhamnosyltransferase